MKRGKKRKEKKDGRKRGRNLCMDLLKTRGKKWT